MLTRITIEKTTNPKPIPAGPLGFGHYFSDHMIECDYSSDKGWGDIYIKPFQNLSLHPAASSLHYGIECFEGLKAYRDKKGQIRLFRPMCNMDRMTVSMKRLCLPEFPKEQFLEAIKECIRVDNKFVPHDRATEEYARSCPGGIGYTKAGGNYAPTIYPATLANAKGFSQILWLYNDYITEGGAMNVMFVIKDKSGLELWTSPLNGLILPGITRDSVIQLCKHWGDIKVCEKEFTIHDLTKLTNEKRVVEAFCTGTAAVLTPIKGFTYNNHSYTFNSGDNIGDLTNKLYDNLLNIQYGDAPCPFPKDPWSIVI